ALLRVIPLDLAAGHRDPPLNPAALDARTRTCQEHPRLPSSLPVAPPPAASPPHRYPAGVTSDDAAPAQNAPGAAPWAPGAADPVPPRARRAVGPLRGSDALHARRVPPGHRVRDSRVTTAPDVTNPTVHQRPRVTT